MDINLQESADWFKLTNEIPNVWGNIILCERCLIVSDLYGSWQSRLRAFRLSDIGRGTNDTPFPPSDIRKEKCPGYEIGFMTKY